MLFERWGATDDEVASSIPGDELIADAPVSATRSISLAARPEEVFGWLAQMGFGRAGWYSYDLIDNLGRRSAVRLHPEWQVQAAGERIPGGPIDFDVTHLRRPDHLVLALLDRRLVGHGIDFTLAYRLLPLDPLDPADDGTGAGVAGAGDGGGGGDGGGTRLVSRARIVVTGRLGRPATAALALGDGIMVRRQLLGLARRCGHRPPR